MAKVSGKAQALSFAGTLLNVTKVTDKTTRKMGDTTDSTNYDAASDMLWQGQIPIKLSKELSVEGWYDLTITPATLIAQLYTGNAPVALIQKINATTTEGHGQFDLSDFETAKPIDDIVAFTGTLMSNGVYTSGS